MTTRSERDHRMREIKTALMGRLAGRAMTTRTTGLDGLAKRLLLRLSGGPAPHDAELDHPDDWDRPID